MDKKKEIIALDMPNGITYIGELIKPLSTTNTIENVVMVPTGNHFPLKHYSHKFINIFDKYINLYEDGIKKAKEEGATLQSLTFEFNIPIAIWSL